MNVLAVLSKWSKIHGLRFLVHGIYGQLVFDDAVMTHTVITNFPYDRYYTGSSHILVFLAGQLRNFINTLKDCW
jgi:hypothetical protein